MLQFKRVHIYRARSQQLLLLLHKEVQSSLLNWRTFSYNITHNQSPFNPYTTLTFCSNICCVTFLWGFFLLQYFTKSSQPDLNESITFFPPSLSLTQLDILSIKYIYCTFCNYSSLVGIFSEQPSCH